MAYSVQGKSRTNFHYRGDEDYFCTVTLQIVAAEARQRYQKFMVEIINPDINVNSEQLKTQSVSFNRLKKNRIPFLIEAYYDY